MADDGLLRIGWVREDNAHEIIVKSLARRVALEDVDWLDEAVLDVMWQWSGLGGEPFTKPVEVEVSGPGGKEIRLHGFIDGKQCAPEARMYRSLLIAFSRENLRPGILIFARDGDGHATTRRRGFEQALRSAEWPFDVLLAMPEPEAEAWFICGFVPRDKTEAAALTALSAELSFNPTTEPHRTTSRPNDAATDTKRILARLGCDPERREQCLQHPFDQLAARGATIGLADFITDLRRVFPKHFGVPPTA